MKQFDPFAVIMTIFTAMLIGLIALMVITESNNTKIRIDKISKAIEQGVDPIAAKCALDYKKSIHDLCRKYSERNK